jgi:hypothetical protein
MTTQRNSIGREKAIALADSHWWELCTAREAAEFQLFTAEPCMPFWEFHRVLTESLGRPVWTHELGLNYDGIVAEFLGERPAPTMEEIIGLIPPEKRVIVTG